MNKSPTLHAQRGVTLIISLLLMLLVTLMVSTGFTLSTSNLTSVGNMQLREEAISASNKAIETVVGSPFTDTPAAQDIGEDINNDGNIDYTVHINTPTCIRASIAGTASLSSTTLGSSMSSSSTWNTVWDITATTTDASTGASITVRSGARVLLSDAQKTLVCP